MKPKQFMTTDGILFVAIKNYIQENYYKQQNLGICIISKPFLDAYDKNFLVDILQFQNRGNNGMSNSNTTNIIM